MKKITGLIIENEKALNKSIDMLFYYMIGIEIRIVLLFNCVNMVSISFDVLKYRSVFY